MGARNIIAIPESLASDSSELADALAVARSLWDRGERDDALRWLRRAVEEAERSGSATRVITLARAIASLCDASPARVGAGPQSQRKTLSGIAPPPPPSARRAIQATTSAASASAPARRVPPASMTLPVVSVARPTSLSASAVKAPAIAPLARPFSTSKPVASPSSIKPLPIPSLRPVASKPPPRPSSAPAATRSAVPLPPSTPRIERAEPLSARKQVRVAVRRSPSNAGLFVVSRLAPGTPPPPGTREAFLLITDADLAALAD